MGEKLISYECDIFLSHFSEMFSSENRDRSTNQGINSKIRNCLTEIFIVEFNGHAM